MKHGDNSMTGDPQDFAYMLHPDGTSTNMKEPYCLDCGSNKIALPSQYSAPRCVVTGNPCGTDTVPAGQNCPSTSGQCVHRPTVMQARDAARYRALRDNEKVRAHAYRRDGHHYIMELERGDVLDERIDTVMSVQPRQGRLEGEQ
jgi:hypothetical protein